MLTAQQVDRAVWLRAGGDPGATNMALSSNPAWEDLIWGESDQFLTIEGADYDYSIVEDQTEVAPRSVTRITIMVNGQFFTKEGYSDSHGDNHWLGPMYESEPVEVTVVEFQRKA